ncbi:MAG: PaaI family thioesterase [bacterium]
MPLFQPVDPDSAERVRASFARQPFMVLLGAEISRLEPGFCEPRLPFRDELCQQHGFFHGGVVGTLADNAAGYASYTLMGGDDSILTVEYKINPVAPGEGAALIARGQVVKPGRTLTVSRAEVFGVKGGAEVLCATSLTTLMTLAGRPDTGAQ